MKNTLVCRLVPVDFLDLDGLELWLEEMAAKGLHFQGFGALFAHFQRGAPAQVRYHAEPTPDKRRDVIPGQAADCGELGWRYVGKVGWLAIFRTEDPQVPDFHTDPVTQSYTLDQITRRLVPSTCLLLAMLAALLAFQVWARLDSAFGPVLSLVKFSSPYTGFVFLLELVFILHLAWEVWGLCRLQRRLRAGIPHQRPAHWRHTGLVRQGYTLLLCVLAAVQIGGAFAYFLGPTRWSTELSALDRPAPVLSLAELEGQGYAPEPFGYPGYEGPDRDNYVSYEWKLLARFYEVDQAGTAGGDRRRLDMEWYSLTLPFLTAPLLDDLMDYQLYDLAYQPERYAVEELTVSGFDRLVIVDDVSYGGQQLFAQAGRRVVYLDYSGSQDLRDHLEEVAGLLTWSGQNRTDV